MQLSRYKLTSFLTCQRRFQLRYVTELRWPLQPVPAQRAVAFQRGEQFHALMERHFLGMPVELDERADQRLAGWWQTFQQKPPKLPAGQRFPEVSLSVPVGGIDGAGGHFLFGRFDLLILNDNAAHIFDWKTERNPRSEAELREEWQTKLYLALATEGSGALGYTYRPDQVAITYWFAEAPEKSVTLRYDAAQHARNWATIKATTERIDRRMVAPDAIWPLTENWEHCKTCAYRNFCGRDVESAEIDIDTLEAATEDDFREVQLEPIDPSLLVH